MLQRHIAFINFPHHPHIGPSLSAVSALARRGHRVTYVTCDRFASRVSQTGAEVVRSPSRESILKEELGSTGNMLVRWTERTLPQITPFYERNRPDVVLYDFAAFAGRILSKTSDIPAIQMGPIYAHERDTLTQQVPDEMWRNWICEYSKMMDSLLEQVGLEGANLFFHREQLNIFWLPRLFQPPGIRPDKSLFYAGRCAGEQPYRSTWCSKDAKDKPVVLVSASTTHLRGTDHFKLCINALSGLDWHVILSIGDEIEASALAPLPEGFEIIKNTPQLAILRCSSLFIFSGGAISAAEAAYNGVPAIATTSGSLELEWLADRFEALGFCVHLKQADMSAERLRNTAIRALKDPNLRRSAAEVQRAVQGEPGGEETANRIEGYIESMF